MHPTRPEPGRFGIRARLLALLLPGMLALLAFDSWNDYRALHDLVQDAYDQTLLEPVSALDNSIGLAADGSIRVNAPFSVEAMFDTIRPQHKHLHVGLTPLPDGPDNGAQPAGEITLVGVSDLPLPPAQPGGNSQSIWYDAVYRGYPVRVVALRRTIRDGHAKPYQVLIQAAEGTDLRLQAQADSLRQELLRDARMVGVVVLLAWLGATWSLRPLERLRKSVQASPPNDLVPLDASRVPYEVAPLVDAVNHHVASHRQMLTEQSRFLADASHQLRTPLAIMLTQAGYALREPDAGRMRETLRAIVTQLSRSRRLSEQLLALAHASQVADDTSPPPIIDLNAVAREVVLQYLPLAHEKNQDLGWVDVRGDTAADDNTDSDSTSDLIAPLAAPVAAHGAELHEALSNLLHNAIRYTPAGGSITVAVRIEGRSVCAEVCDSGPGIAEHRRDGVFERFQQPTTYESPADHGAGLGLAIARAYARHNGGDIELADLAANSAGAASSTTGLRAILRLPLASGRQG